MRITERHLRQIIRNVIKESIDNQEEEFQLEFEFQNAFGVSPEQAINNFLSSQGKSVNESYRYFKKLHESIGEKRLEMLNSQTKAGQQVIDPEKEKELARKIKKLQRKSHNMTMSALLKAIGGLLMAAGLASFCTPIVALVIANVFKGTAGSAAFSFLSKLGFYNLVMLFGGVQGMSMGAELIDHS